MENTKIETTELDSASAPAGNDRNVNESLDSKVIDNAMNPDVNTVTGDANGAAEKGHDALIDAVQKDETVIEGAAKELSQKHIERDAKSPAQKDQSRPSQPDRKRPARSNDQYRGSSNKRFRDNVKSDLTSQPESSDPFDIRKQVEFYFSDSNLPQDKFLFDQVGGSANKPIPIKVIHSFKRMRHFQPYSAVVAALRESEMLEVTENEEIQRKVPLPSEDEIKRFEDRTLSRSIYAKGFGEEKPSTQFDIEAFFTPYGPTNAVRLRRDQHRNFKGSVFVEFDSDETQKAFLDLDSKPQFEGKELKIMSKQEYVEGKAKDIAEGKIKPNNWSYHNRQRKPRGEGDGDREEKDWRERRDQDAKNGFRDDRGGRGGRGRGGRGRGRGERGRGGRDRRDRDDRRDRTKAEPEKAAKDERYVAGGFV